MIGPRKDGTQKEKERYALIEELEKYQAEYQLRRQTEKKEPYVFYLVPLHVFMNIGQEGS